MSERDCETCEYWDGDACCNELTNYWSSANNRRDGEPCGIEGKLWEPRTVAVPQAAIEPASATPEPAKDVIDTPPASSQPAASAPPPLPVLMPTDAAERKRIPLYSGLMAYFPDALLCVARVSHIGNEQHHPGTPLHWDKSKSADEPDALLRHMAGQEWDIVAWRALANLQRKIDAGWRPEWAKKEAGQ